MLKIWLSGLNMRMAASFYRKVKGVLDLTPNDYIRLGDSESSLLLKQNEYKVNRDSSIWWDLILHPILQVFSTTIWDTSQGFSG